MITAIVIGLVVAATALAITWVRLYVKTPPNLAFIRTGALGKKVIIDGGDLVLPWVQSIQWISLETFKLDVLKAAGEAFITKDRFRVDIGAECHVRIPPERAMIERASRSLGEKSFSAEGIRALVEERLVGVLRGGAASLTLFELHENRRAFALKVKETLAEAVADDGLALEDVSIYHLDQTAREHLDPSNVFDADGLMQITAQAATRTREPNEIERDTEVSIRQKDVEAVKLTLGLEQEQAFAQVDTGAVRRHLAEQVPILREVLKDTANESTAEGGRAR